MGIRLALGATISDLNRLVLRQGMILTAAGIFFGIVGSAVISRFLSALLYGVSPIDPLAFGMAALIMFAVALAKSYKSPWAGIYLSLGHAVIEVPLILLIYFGFARFFENTIVQVVLSILGGGMIIWLGVAMFRARTEVIQKGKDLPYNAFVAGILTSGFNPF